MRGLGPLVRVWRELSRPFMGLISESLEPEVEDKMDALYPISGRISTGARDPLKEAL